jgi:hypothetical protein
MIEIPGASMKLLTNPTGSYLTGDEIADAVLHYGLVLARRRDIDIVNVPFLNAQRAICRVEMTIGWQSNTTAISDASPTDELLEADTIVALYAKADRVGRTKAQPFTDHEFDEMQWMQFDLEDYR